MAGYVTVWSLKCLSRGPWWELHPGKLCRLFKVPAVRSFYYVHVCSVPTVVPDSFRPYGLYPARLLCSWDSPGKNTGVGCHFLLQGIFLSRDQTRVSCIGRQILYHWAVVPFSCPLSFPASGSFPMSQCFASGGQSIRVSASASVLQMNIQDWFPLRLTW